MRLPCKQLRCNVQKAWGEQNWRLKQFWWSWGMGRKPNTRGYTSQLSVGVTKHLKTNQPEGGNPHFSSHIRTMSSLRWPHCFWDAGEEHEGEKGMASQILSCSGQEVGGEECTLRGSEAMCVLQKYLLSDLDPPAPNSHNSPADSSSVVSAFVIKAFNDATD